jgi:hypothetical protein
MARARHKVALQTAADVAGLPPSEPRAQQPEKTPGSNP